MKTYLINLKSSLVLFCLIFLPIVAQASKELGRVYDLKGENFAILDGKTFSLKNSQDLTHKMEVLTGDESEIAFHNYHDHVFSLNQQGHVIIENDKIVLIRGSLWIQNKKQTLNPLKITTANSVVNFETGETIVSFDQKNSRTHVMAISGESSVASLTQSNVIQPLAAGQFTIITPDYENGQPRQATKVGYDSLINSIQKFALIKTQDYGLAKSSEQQRKIASTDENSELPQKGKITMMTTYLDSDDQAHSYFVKKVKPQPFAVTKKLTQTKSVAPVRIWGHKEVKATVHRLPASVKTKVIIPTKKEEKSLLTDQEFINSLKKHEHDQPLHKPEMQRLIDELKSF